jgi:hypothetical protein
VSQTIARAEPCPDCGAGIAIDEGRLRRKRARCARCALDVQLDNRDVGEGAGRTSAYLEMTAPALLRPQRLRVERDARHLLVTLSPGTRITAAASGLAIAMLLVLAGVVGWLPLVVAGVGFLAVLALGFTVAAREQVRFQLVVERGVVRINGRGVEPALPDADLPEEAALSAHEVRWLRDVVAARVAGDLD